MMSIMRDPVSGYETPSLPVLDPDFGALFALRNEFGSVDVDEDTWGFATVQLDARIASGCIDIPFLGAEIVRFHSYLQEQEEMETELDLALVGELAAVRIQCWWRLVTALNKKWERAMDVVSDALFVHASDEALAIARANTIALSNGTHVNGRFRHYCIDTCGAGTVVYDVCANNGQAGAIEQRSAFVCKSSYETRPPKIVSGPRTCTFRVGENPRNPSQHMATNLCLGPPTESSILGQDQEGQVVWWDGETGKITFGNAQMSWRVWFHSSEFRSLHTNRSSSQGPVGATVRFRVIKNRTKKSSWMACQVPS